MTERNISANFDYVKRVITANLVGPSNSPPYANYLFRMYDEEGTIVSNFYMPELSASAYGDLYSSTSSFGLDLSAFWPSYDSSFGRTDLSGVYVGIGFTNWELSAEADFPFSSYEVEYVEGVVIPYLNNRTAYESYFITGANNILEKRNNKYTNDKLLIKKGDAVLQGTIATVSNKNIITITSDKLAASYTGYNLNSCIVEVLSGSASGQTMAVTSHALGSTSIYVDRDCFGMSGQIVRVMPYREVTSYSGWSYTGFNNNQGKGGVLSRFGLADTIPNKIGSMVYPNGTYLTTEMLDHPSYSSSFTLDFYTISTLGDGDSGDDPPRINGPNPLKFIITGYVCSKVRLANDNYLRDISIGDLVVFNPNSSPASTATGIILKCTGVANKDISYWPDNQPSAGSTYTIVRNNIVRLDCFPEFDKTYNCAAFPSNDNTNPFPFNSVYGSGAVFSNIKTPSVDLEFSANEYEGAFGTTTYTSHFHIGPVKLSNGQILNDSVTLTGGGTTPFLFFSGVVQNGNPNSPSTVLDRKGFSTQNTNVAGNFDGSYYKDGVMTFTSNVAFNASETLVCKATVGYGSAKIERVFTIPVQPAV